MILPLSNPNPADGNPGREIDFSFFLDCVHCGLCTSSCPTYTELGDENDGPRGRIYLMRLITEGQIELTPRVRRHLDACLDCRGCETACPSGVHYGRLIEPFRLAMEEKETSWEKRYDWFREIVLLRLFPHPGRIRLAMTPVRWAQRSGPLRLAGADGVVRADPRAAGTDGHAGQPAGRVRSALAEIPAGHRPAASPRGFLRGLRGRRHVPPHALGHAAGAPAQRLRRARARGAGLLRGDPLSLRPEPRRPALADANVAAFAPDEVDAVIVNHAGCGAMLKEYGLHWQDDRREARQRLAEKVRDINEFLDQLGPIAPTGRIDAVATYHDACHLAHAQKVRQAPRRLLSQVPGLELRDLPQSDLCCGSAGTYNLNQPSMAARLAARKLENIVRTGAQIVLASNAGCLLQIGREVRQQRQPLAVMHPMDLLDLSYRNEKPVLPKSPS